jgi:hypothetical protein
MGGFRSAQSREPVLTGERKLSLARQGGLTNSTRSASPRLKAVGYGSYAGFADGRSSPAHGETPASGCCLINVELDELSERVASDV